MSNRYAEISKLRLVTRHKDNKTILDDVYFTSPFKITHPFYINNNFIKVILMSSSAGTLEGDFQEYEISLGDNTNMELTSQSFEKIFTMLDDEAFRECNIYIGSNSLLRYNLLPTIPYKDSAFNSKTKIKLKDNTSRLIYTDIINCGRVARGEKFEYKYYKSYIEIESKQDEKIIYLDNTMYKPEETNMNNFGMFEGYTHFANIIIVNINDYEEKLDEIRKIINDECFIMNGDAQMWTEIVRFDQVIGVAESFYRDEKLISCDSKRYKIYMKLWVLCKPIRPLIFRMASVVRKFKRK